MLLKMAVEYAEKSDGAFDVTAGPLVRLWGFMAREKRQQEERQQQELSMPGVCGHRREA